MKLTPQQLHIMQRAKKDLTFGCIIKPLYSSEEEEYQRILGWERRPLKGADYYEVVLLSEEAGIHNDHTWIKSDIDIIGHPFGWGRLCFLFSTALNYAIQNKKPKMDMIIDFDNITKYTTDKCNILQQTVLERPTDFLDLVEKFLESLPSNTNE